MKRNLVIGWLVLTGTTFLFLFIGHYGIWPHQDPEGRFWKAVASLIALMGPAVRYLRNNPRKEIPMNDEFDNRKTDLEKLRNSIPELEAEHERINAERARLATDRPEGWLERYNVLREKIEEVSRKLSAAYQERELHDHGW